jgi:hypothetical protein
MTSAVCVLNDGNNVATGGLGEYYGQAVRSPHMRSAYCLPAGLSRCAGNGGMTQKMPPPAFSLELIQPYK